MSIMDKSLEFCDNVDVKGSTGTALKGDVIPLSAAHDLGDGYTLYLVIAVSVAFTSGTASTVQFTLASDATDTIATNGDATEHYKSEVFAHTALTKGKTIIVPLPMGIPEPEGYLGLLVTTGSAATTAGSVNAYLTLDPPQWKAYPEGAN